MAGAPPWPTVFMNLCPWLSLAFLSNSTTTTTPHEILSPDGINTPHQVIDVPQRHHHKQTKNLFANLPIIIFISACFIYKLGHLGTHARQPSMGITAILHHGRQAHSKTAQPCLGCSHHGLHHDSNIICQASSKAVSSPVGRSQPWLLNYHSIMKTSFILATTATEGSVTTSRKRTYLERSCTQVHPLTHTTTLGGKVREQCIATANKQGSTITKAVSDSTYGGPQICPQASKGVQPPRLSVDSLQASKGVRQPRLSVYSTYGGPRLWAPGGKLHVTYSSNGLATAYKSLSHHHQTTSL
jgi:hypothetical protein